MNHYQFQQKQGPGATHPQQQLTHLSQGQHSHQRAHPHPDQQPTGLYSHQSVPNGGVNSSNSTYPSGGNYYQTPTVGMAPVQLARSSMTPTGPFNQPRSASSSSSSPHSHGGPNTGTYPPSSPLGLDMRRSFFTTPTLPQTSEGPISMGMEEGMGMQGGHHSLGPSPLRRGQACQACRRRKLKCNAVRPVCGTCTRSRKAAASANHVSPVPDGDCVYDDGPVSSTGSTGAGLALEGGTDPPLTAKPSSKARRSSHAVVGQVEIKHLDAEPETVGQKRRRTMDGGTNEHEQMAWPHPKAESPCSTIPGESPAERSKRLESRVQYLENLLRQSNDAPTRRGDANEADEADFKRWGETLKPAVPIFSMLSPSSGREEKYRMQYSQRPARHPEGKGADPSKGTGGVGMGDGSRESKVQQPPPLFDFSMDGMGINRDEQVRHEIANGHLTREDPILQLLWPGWSTDLPSPDTVTALCETFFRLHPMKSLVYKPSFMSGLSLPAKHPHRPHDSLIHAILSTTADLSPFHEAVHAKKQDKFMMLLSDPRARFSQSKDEVHNYLSFKEFHLRKAREKVEHSLITDFRNPLDWIAACLLSCFTLWNDFRITESYFLGAILTRATSPAGLDKLPTRHFSDDAEVVQGPGLFGSVDGIEEHERRMTMWHIFITDQITSGAPSFYECLLSESSILTHLPCRVADFQGGKDLAPNTQTLASPDLFRTGHLDDFTLHIKSSVLVRRACTFFCRNQLAKKKPNGLSLIDKSISEFMQSFPSFDFGKADQISVDKLVAWSNISLALFHLHEPYLTPTAITAKEANPSSNYSVDRITLGVERVLEMIHHLMNSSFDFSLLHPQIFVSWSVCGRMLGKDLDFLKRKGQGVESAMEKVMNKLQWIIWALERAGEKNLKARRCSELVAYVRSGTLQESMLGRLLYTDGVIPTGEEDNGSASATTATMASEDPSFDALLLSASADSNGGSEANLSPETSRFSLPNFPNLEEASGAGPEHSLRQSFPASDVLLNFSL